MSTETEQTTKKRRPAHETLAEAIRRARDLDQLQLLAWLLRVTDIPKGHDELITAWKEKRLGLGLSLEDEIAVLNELEEQKAKADEKAAKQAEEAAKPLFPPYLDQGSTGAAVNVLGLLLKIVGYGDPDLIVLDGDYTPDGVIAENVKNFQLDAGFTDDEVDGNFGPATRAAFKAMHYIDVDELTVEMFTMPTVGKGPETDE